jgi:hypothetical protein
MHMVVLVVCLQTWAGAALASEPDPPATQPAEGDRPPAPAEPPPRPSPALTEPLFIQGQTVGTPMSLDSAAADEVALDGVLRAMAEYTFEADFKGDPGSVSISRAAAGVGIGARLSQQLRLNVDFDAEASRYHFTNATGLIAGTANPFEDMHRFNLGGRLTYILDDQWSVYAGGGTEIAGENGAGIGDSTVFGGSLGARCVLDKDLALSLGFAARTSLEARTYYVPWIGVEWQVSDKVSFNVRGLGAELRAQIAREWFASLDTTFEIREYRLNDSNPLPFGVVRDHRVPVGVGLTYRPSGSFDITLRGGVVVWQQFIVDNQNGVQQSETNTQAAPLISLSGQFRF